MTIPMIDAEFESNPADVHVPRVDSADRRNSCRYPVAEVPALLGWWEGPQHDPEPVNEPVEDVASASPRSSGPDLYAALMMRGPAFRKGVQAYRPRVEGRPRATDGPNEDLRLCSCRVLIQDISQSGLSVRSDMVPDAQQRLRVRLGDPQPTAWVEVSLRGTAPLEGGGQLIRFAFLDPCPYDLFKTVVYGKPDPRIPDPIDPGIWR